MLKRLFKAPRLQLSTAHQPQKAPKMTTTANDFKNMSWKAGGIFGISSILMLGYFYYSKLQIDVERSKRQNESIGKPLVGGPFELVNQDGYPVTNDTYKNKLMLIYFGYTVSSLISFVLMFVQKNWIR